MADRLVGREANEEKVRGAVAAAKGPRPARADGGAGRRWMDHVSGWAEIESLCAGAFWAEEMATDWPAWRGLIERWRPITTSTSAARRWCCSPADRTSDDARCRDLGFVVIERLKPSGRS